MMATLADHIDNRLDAKGDVRLRAFSELAVRYGVTWTRGAICKT